MNSAWRKITGFEDYFISDAGEIWSEKSKKILSLATDKDGYKIATLYREGGYKKMKVHRLVATMFIDKDIDGKQINHIDEDPGNNRAENLEVCDCSYNINYGTRNKKVSEKLKVTHWIPKKPVDAYSEAGDLLFHFDSMHDAERAGYNRAAIKSACSEEGGLYSYRGMIWRYNTE